MVKKTRKEELIEKRAAIDALIRQEQSKENEAKRKIDTRRKILAGAAILSEAEKKPDIKTGLYKLLDSFLVREDDRKLFDLPPLTPPAHDVPSAPVPVDDWAKTE